MQRKVSNGQSQFSETVLKLDPFAQNIQILFENEKPKLQTHCGAVFGIVMVVIILAFAALKTDELLEYRTMYVQAPNQPNYFDGEYIYTAEKHGYHIAFGISAYDQSGLYQIPLDDSYGKLVAYQRQWGFGDVQNVPLTMRSCSRDETDWEGTEDDNFNFYQPEESYLDDINKFYSKLMCLEDPYEL